MEPQYTTVPLEKEEFEALSKEMTALLEKYNCEIGITSNLQMLKRIPQPVESPYATTTETTKEEPNTETTESGDGDSKESA